MSVQHLEHCLAFGSIAQQMAPNCFQWVPLYLASVLAVGNQGSRVTVSNVNMPLYSVVQNTAQCARVQYVMCTLYSLIEYNM